MPKISGDNEHVFHAWGTTDDAGQLTVTNEGSYIRFVVPKPPSATPGGEVAEPAPRSEPPPQRPPKKIVLGPLRRPPLPRSIAIVQQVGGGPSGASSPPILNLATAIEDDTFTETARKKIRDAAASAVKDRPVRIDAFLPPNHEINLTLLARHIAHEGEKISRDIQLHIGSYLVE